MQLGAVISPIIEALDPDLVIVFGSAARATMTADSDVDLLVVKDVANVRELGSRARDCLPDRHPPVDVLGATRELLSNHRESLSWVYGPAMAEGIVAYERDTKRSNGRRRAWDAVATEESVDERVVRTFRYQREEMCDWLEKARKDMTIVTSKDRSIDPAQYPGWDGTTTAADEKSFCTIAGELYAHARERAPEVLQARNPQTT